MRSTMNIRKIVLALLPLLLMAAAPPNVRLEVGTEGGSVEGMPPGEQVAWTGLVRVPEGNLERVKVVHGISTVDASGELSMPANIATGARTVWLLASVTSADAGFRIATDAEADPEQIVVRFDGANIEVEAAAIDLTYIQPDGKAFFFFGADGSFRDEDHDQNGVIVVSVSKLQNFPTVPADPNPPSPPSAVQPGARVEIFDLYEWREAQMVVPQ